MSCALQHGDRIVSAQIARRHDEDREPRLSQRGDLDRSIPDPSVLREEHPTPSGHRRKEIGVDRRDWEVVVMDLHSPAQFAQPTRNAATEVAVAEEDYAAGRNQNSYLSACSTSSAERSKSVASSVTDSSAWKRLRMISVRTAFTCGSPNWISGFWRTTPP